MCATDIFTLKGVDHLVVGNFYSKMIFVWCIPPSQSNDNKVVSLLKDMSPEYGIPKVLCSDNGPQYASSQFADFCISRGITHETSSLNYPQSNGFAEAHVKSIKHALQWAKYSSADPQLTLLALQATPSFHLQQSCCTNANSEKLFWPRYATATHQPYKSMSRLTHALKLLKHRLTNVSKHLHHCMLVNQLQYMTPPKRFGFLLLWYMSYHRTAIKYAPAMVPHTATHGDTFVSTVSKQPRLSQVPQLPHCRLQPDTTSQWHNLHCPHLHSTCSPHPLHLQHWWPRWNRLQLFLPCQLFKRMPWHQCLWHLMPHLCSHKDPAVPTWHPDAWSRKSKNFQPRLSMDLVIIMWCHIHPQSFIELNHYISYSQKGGCCIITHFTSRTNPLVSWSCFMVHIYIGFLLLPHMSSGS